MDWLFGAVACVALGALAAAVLLWASDLGRRDPSALSLYAAAVIFCLFAPAWLLYTALAWAWCGATAGMAIARVQLVSKNGSRPGVWSSAARAVLLAMFTAPVLLAPLLAALALSIGSLGPPVLFLPIAGAVVASAAACGSPFFVPTRQAWHDNLSCTRVVMTTRSRLSAAPP